ncbi:DUF6056 family protein [Providencia rettgeri]|uniref:DUF6056 family protein n=2 Tax=Providencia rettgeri TaxID=587 RepID=UPI001F0344F0|nr:DUF6056 family protein [Providencia rettgeri]MCG9941585.1 DUF6056 family protein [Providencia rettgeri]
MSKYFHNFNIQYFVLFIPFVLIFIIEYLTPMQSDDFVYYIKGNSLSIHLDHYFSWSGRFVSDYFSTLILSADSQLLKSTVIAAILTATLFLIVKMGDRLNAPNNRFYLQFLSLFFIYWVTTPNVGQIVFWVVGAGNYLVTNFFVVLFLYALMRYINKKKGITLLLFVSFFAGCSNENTTWIVLLISLITSCYFFIREKKKVLFLSTLLVLIGFSVLIFSPGNFHRAALATEFYELGLLEKIWLFLSEKLPYALSKTWIPLLVSLVLLTTFINTKKYKNFYLSLLFIALGLLSTISMVASPSFPTRALSGPHLFYIISCSFSISYTLTSKNIKSLSILFVISTLALISFIFSYIQIVFSYNSVKTQEKIRNYEIHKKLITNEQTNVIPAFYYPKTLRAGDSIDLYHDAGATGKYYKLSHPVDVYPIKYNYAVIVNGEKIALPDSEKTGLSNIFIGRDTFFKGTSIAIQLDNINDEVKIEIKTKNNKIYKIKELNINSLYGMNVIGFTVPALPSEIDSITYQSPQGEALSIRLSM